MELINRNSHPDCVYASNPYHECASACLERIAQGHGRKHTKKQASKILSFSASFRSKKKESEPPSPYASRPYQNNGFANNNSAKDHRPIPPPDAVKKKTFLQDKKSFSSSSSEELPVKNLVVDPSNGKTPTPGRQEHREKNGAAGEIRSFSFLSPPRSHDHDLESNDGEDDEGEEEEEDNGVLGEKIELESIMSESCVSVGKHRVRPGASKILRSIIDKHGDVAADCKLESASMRARYLESLCSLVQELKSTPAAQLTKPKVKEMLAVLKDLDAVSIDVEWLRSVLEEFQEAEAEKERHESLVRSTRKAMEDEEAGLARMEEEVMEARARVEEARARLVELEEQGSRLERFKGRPFLDELL